MTDSETGRTLGEFVDGLPLLDHHCHGVVRTDLDRAGFESLASESDWPAPPGQTHLDSQAGIAIRAVRAGLRPGPALCPGDKPVQFHVGYGDSDIVMHRCDPTKMTGFLQATRGSGVNVMLLHCYPFQREAGYLAHVYPHVWLDTGAAVSYTGPNSLAVVRESLEVAPFGKVLFSTDAFGLPELYLCGARLWRRALGLLLGEWVSSDWLSPADARRYAAGIASRNARIAYGLAEQ